ncbi:MAG: glutamate racemase [Balneolaceae bacterium]
MPDSTSPIGIFDSGIGGLTVAKAVANLLPNEQILYFGDTARVPYGIKSEEVIRKYSEQITRFLLRKGVKMILIACNSVSATALESVLKTAGDTPVLNVIEAGADAVVASHFKRVGVIGTLATTSSRAYEKALRERDPDIRIISRACPMLVPLAEEGWIDNEITRLTLREYLKPLEKEGMEALILGCTHYPLFTPAIRNLIKDKDLKIIDSADSIAAAAGNALETLRLRNSSAESGSFQCFVSDRPQRFQELAERFLGRTIHHIEIVDLE